MVFYDTKEILSTKVAYNLLFTSMEFLCLFLPLTLALYYILPHHLRNVWLLGMSLLFYAWGEPVFLLAMLFSIVFNYCIALRIDELKKQKAPKKLLLALAVVVNLGILFVYKYMNFITATLHSAFPATVNLFPKTNFSLPIGISFFTFQALSYVIDVYRGVPAQRKITHIGLYISLFPQLIAGPIVRYTTVMEQLDNRQTTPADFSKGMLRFLRGFNKKMLLANITAQVADLAFDGSTLSVGMAWLGAICYALQIFFDFSGYSDMAIGLGKMIGFDFLENFNYPYISKTITEFWRRWHISLGTWFRDYVYFPLGGSRVKSKFKLVFNLSVVWLATGIWHGANWTFIAWGVLYGILIIIEKLLDLPKRLPKHKYSEIPYQIFTLLMVLLGWVLFRAPSMDAAWNYLKSMFGLNGNALLCDRVVLNLPEYAVIIVAGLVCSTPVFKRMKEKLQKKNTVLYSACDIMGYLLQMALFGVSISFLAMNAHNPFIYFNF